MSNFSEIALEKKLHELNSSQQSIQTLSLWLIHHRKHYNSIVKVWFKQLLTVKPEKKLTFLYLANDVIQNSKKKGPEFGKEFSLCLKKVFDHIGKLHPDEKTANGILRLIQIWEERNIYDEVVIKDFKNIWFHHMGNAPEGQAKTRLADEAISEAETPNKKAKLDRNETKNVRIDSDVNFMLSPNSPTNESPEPDELIHLLKELQNAASGDAATRECIARFSPEISDTSLLSKLQDKNSAEQLLKQVNEALTILVNYNGRLVTELEERKKLELMLQSFLQIQKELLSKAEQHLEEYKEKLHQVCQVHQELRAHLQSLPDLTKLPDVTGGLRPLPSAGDLFSLS